MPVWLIAAIVAAWIVLVIAFVAAGIVWAYFDERRELGDMSAEIIELPTGYTGTEPRPHVEVGVREALDAAASNPANRVRPGYLQN
jgi:cbb3-type cytochrome oxidase subunit 3